MRPSIRIAILLLPLGLMTALAAYAKVGRIPARYTVGSAGGFKYSIPIDLPPGPDGVEPHLALSYDSSVGQARPLAGTSDLDAIPAGAGWVLEGLSQIGRTSRTVADDGAASPVSFAPGDAYEVDGERLRLTGSTAAGESGATYQTELANFTRFTVHSSNGNGPGYWTAQLKDGLTYDYGETSDSAIQEPLVSGGAPTRLWLLDKVNDAYGNSYVITYGAGATGSYHVGVPTSISYTPSGSGSSTYNYKITFDYQARSSEIAGLVNGASVAIVNDNLLSDISISYKGTTFRYYKLNYTQSKLTGRELLTSIQECTDSSLSDCLGSTSFTYDDTGTPGVSSSVQTAVSGAGKIIGAYDFAGNGLSDILYVGSGSSEFYAKFSNGSGFGSAVATGADVGSGGDYAVGDITGDGRDDLLAPVNGVWQIYTWNGSGFNSASLGLSYNAACRYQIADVNGDGRPDFLQLCVANDAMTLSVALNTSSGGTAAFGAFTPWTVNLGIPQYTTGQVLNAWFGTPQTYYQTFRHVDFEGDGIDDPTVIWETEMQQGGQTYDVDVADELVPAGNAFNSSEIEQYTTQAGDPAPQMFYGDFNSDKCTDFSFAPSPSTEAYLYLSGCNGASSQIDSSAGVIVGATDWNGDGLTDLLVNDSGDLGIEVGDGDGVSSVSSTGIPLQSGDTVMPLSVTGSGLPDIGIINGGTLTYYLHNKVASQTDAYPDLLSQVTDGNGNKIGVTYASIGTGTGIYTLGTTANPGEYDWTGKLFVVQSLSLPTGTGSSYTKTYKYQDARWSILRGFEGFSQIRATDSRNGEVRASSYDLLFPLTGMTSEKALYQSDGSTPISTTKYENTDLELDSTQYEERYFTYADKVTRDRYGVDGADGQLDSQTVTDYTPDNYGNFTKIDTTVTDESNFAGDSWKTDASASYADDMSTWCLGLPTSISVEKTAGSEPMITHTTTYTRDGSNCRASSITEDAGQSAYDVTRAFQYDGFGNVRRVTLTGAGGMSPRVWTDNWGATGQFPVTIQDPAGYANGYEKKIGYDYSLGLKTSEVVQTTGGVEGTPPTQWSYGSFGRIKQETLPDGTSVNWTYASCSSSCYGGMEQIGEEAESSSGAEISNATRYLDSFGRTVATLTPLEDGSSSLVERQYDALGNLKARSTHCAGSGCPAYWTHISYDALNRAVSITSPDPQSAGTTDTTQIARDGDSTTVTNAKGQVSTQVRDATGALRKTVDATGYGQTFTYDSDGNLLNVSDGNGTITSRTYDYGGEGDYLATRDDRALGAWSYEPDALGDVINYTDAKGQTFHMVYDGLGRLEEREDDTGASGGPTAVRNWTWGVTPSDHDVGKLVKAQVTTSAGTYTDQNSYDADGRLAYRDITIPGDATYQYAYAYDPTTGELSQLQYPAAGSDDLTLDYGYQNGVLSQVKDASTGVVYWKNDNGVNALGEVTEDTLGNGIVTERTFSPVTGELEKAISGLTAGSATAQNTSYYLDALGNVVQRQDNNQGLTETFDYDEDNRVVSSTLSDGKTTTTNLQISYNPDGSMSQKTETGGTDAPVGYSVTWTSYNYPKKISATLSSGQTESATFDYGPGRQRWRMVYTEGTASETTEYIGKLMRKVTSSSGTTYRYDIYGADGLSAVQQVAGGTPTTYYVLSNQLGSVSSLLYSDASTDVNESFTAFGNRRDATHWSGPPSASSEAAMDGITRRGFTGQTVLGNMGLNDMNARIEDAVTGTFLSPDPHIADPANTQDYYRYAYVYDNPLTYVDPSGFTTCLIAGPGGTCWTATVNGCNEAGCGQSGIPSWASLENMDVTETSCPATCVAVLDSLGGGSSAQSSTSGTTGATQQSNTSPQSQVCSHYAAQAAFVKANATDAAEIASLLDTTPGNILGLAGFESGWGNGPLIAAGSNNYFSLKAGPAFATLNFFGTTTLGSNTFWNYPGPGLYASGFAFANSYFGERVFGTQTAQAFAEALDAGNKYNSNSSYEATLESTISQANKVMGCP